MSTNKNSERRARAHDAHARWQARHDARTIRYVIRHIPVGAHACERRGETERLGRVAGERRANEKRTKEK